MTLFRERGTDFEEHRTKRGTARMWTLSPAVYVTQVEGHMDESHAALFERYGAAKIADSPGGLCVFHDWIEMTGYDSPCRKRMTEWSVARLGAYREVHIAVRSKLVAMGIQVANIALRGLMRAHRDRVGLEVELRRVIRNESRRDTTRP
ncbi:MAG TPA: hypothetical protein VHE30_10275 [Polyangiaceae bacterium]|nr:hypothetical protein [Polyangiaceae bacterium]